MNDGGHDFRIEIFGADAERCLAIRGGSTDRERIGVGKTLCRCLIIVHALCLCRIATAVKGRAVPILSL